MTAESAPAAVIPAEQILRCEAAMVFLQEAVMIRKQFRIVLATLSVFITLGALGAVVHGMLFGDQRIFAYAIAALIASIVAFVALLNPTARDQQ
ncbi:DUF2964 family protein [Burkholderia stagnalis]|uniref:DUF2964 family protein n=1 Tax=Burkholderia stagnalis TaxID=1503054 RepID=UPI001E65D112|nr:DUF2964 family protein [Burkholderia stagnalis]